MRIQRTLLASVFFVTGIALLISLVAHIPLLLNITILGAVLGAIAQLVLCRLPLRTRRETLRHIDDGLRIGLVATVAYDVSRYLLVTMLQLQVWPFEALPHFGQLLVGQWLGAPWTLAAGIIYHVANGVFFGAAYSLLFGARGWHAGVLWGLGLEIVMVAIYPGWLNVKAFNEFISMSFVGHIVYGLVLGVGCQWRRKRYVCNESQSDS